MKTMYRTSLFPNHNVLCQELAVECAISNGKHETEKTTIEDLKKIFETERMKYSTANANMTFEEIGNHLVHLDRKVGDNYETVLILEQVELLEVPTLPYSGITDELNHEVLN